MIKKLLGKTSQLKRLARKTHQCRPIYRDVRSSPGGFTSWRKSYRDAKETEHPHFIERSSDHVNRRTEGRCSPRHRQPSFEAENVARDSLAGRGIARGARDCACSKSPTDRTCYK